MKALTLILVSFALLRGSGLHAAVASLPPVQTAELADRVLNKGLAEIDLGLYPGTLLLQGMSELAANRADPELLQRTVALYKKFATKEIKGRGSFISYEVGGSGAAFLRQRGLTNELDAFVAEAAKRMVEKQKRSSEGLLVPPWTVTEKDQVFIDIAFAVTPYLLYSGLAEHNAAYIDLAVFETLELFRILRDKKTGLLLKAVGFRARTSSPRTTGVVATAGAQSASPRWCAICPQRTPNGRRSKPWPASFSRPFCATKMRPAFGTRR